MVQGHPRSVESPWVGGFLSDLIYRIFHHFRDIKDIFIGAMLKTDFTSGLVDINNWDFHLKTTDNHV